MQVGACLGMNNESLAARLDVALRHDIRRQHHEMCLKGFLRVRANRCDDIGAKGQVGDELSVHHVKLNDVDARFIERMNFLAKFGEISGKN